VQLAVLGDAEGSGFIGKEAFAPNLSLLGALQRWQFKNTKNL
jgi:hypothetical protein